MSIREKINADFILAFKAKEMDKKNFLGVVKGEIQNEEGRGVVITDDVVLKILRKMEKSLTQTNTEESLNELGYLRPYLPKMMEYDDIEKIISGYYNDKGLTTVSSMMKEFNMNFKNMADNNMVVSVINKTIAGR